MKAILNWLKSGGIMFLNITYETPLALYQICELLDRAEEKGGIYSNGAPAPNRILFSDAKGSEIHGINLTKNYYGEYGVIKVTTKYIGPETREVETELNHVMRDRENLRLITTFNPEHACLVIG